MANEVKLPALGENTAGGDVIEVKVKVGDDVTVGQGLFEIEAEKSSVEVPSPSAGKITQINVKKGDRVSTGQLLAMIEGGGRFRSAGVRACRVRSSRCSREAGRTCQTRDADSRREARAGRCRACCRCSAGWRRPNCTRRPRDSSARSRLGREFGNRSAVRPLWPRHTGRRQEPTSALSRPAAASSNGSDQDAAAARFLEMGRHRNSKPVEGVRKRTAEHMSLCWNVIPHVTQHDNADCTDIEAFRKQQEGKGPKLTVTAFVLKAVSILLKQYPQFNSSLDWENKQLILKSYCNIGVAVDTDRGLVVPVLRDVDKKSVHEIGKEMTEVAERARNGKLTPDDMKGGTFTISNLGGIGGTAFTPIVNWPEVAILGLSRSRMVPVWKDGQFVPRLSMPMSMSYDHRVIDGADAARFARKLAELLENPMVMLLHA